MCTMSVESQESEWVRGDPEARGTCTQCSAPIWAVGNSTALCHQCACDFASQPAEVMVSSATSDEVRQLNWIEVHDLGLHDFAPMEDQVALRESSATRAGVTVGGADPDVWELLTQDDDIPRRQGQDTLPRQLESEALVRRADRAAARRTEEDAQQLMSASATERTAEEDDEHPSEPWELMASSPRAAAQAARAALSPPAATSSARTVFDALAAALRRREPGISRAASAWPTAIGTQQVQAGATGTAAIHTQGGESSAEDMPVELARDADPLDSMPFEVWADLPADFWEDLPAEFWSVVPAEVLATLPEGVRRREDSEFVQHVIAANLIEELHEAETALTGSAAAATSMSSPSNELGQLANSDVQATSGTSGGGSSSSAAEPFGWDEVATEASLQNSSSSVGAATQTPRGETLDPTVASAVSLTQSDELPVAELLAPGQAVCIVCVKAAAVATFVHGLTGHTACCLRCAQEVQRRGNACPVCRQDFTAVIRNFVAA